MCNRLLFTPNLQSIDEPIIVARGGKLIKPGELNIQLLATGGLADPQRDKLPKLVQGRDGPSSQRDQHRRFARCDSERLMSHLKMGHRQHAVGRFRANEGGQITKQLRQRVDGRSRLFRMSGMGAEPPEDDAQPNGRAGEDSPS